MNELLLRRRALMMAQTKSRLPSAYQEVEYLESNNGALISLGLLKNVDQYFGVQVKFFNSSSNFWVCGSVHSAGYITDIGINRSSIRYGTEYVTGLNLFNRLETAEVNNRGYTLNGNFAPWANSPSLAAIAKEFLLFAAGGSSLTPSGRIYFFKLLSSDGVDLYYLIPCYRKSDNKPGMYDLVTKTFFTNAGTGEFIVGPNVN